MCILFVFYLYCVCSVVFSVYCYAFVVHIICVNYGILCVHYVYITCILRVPYVLYVYLVCNTVYL